MLFIMLFVVLCLPVILGLPLFLYSIAALRWAQSELHHRPQCPRLSGDRWTELHSAGVTFLHAAPIGRHSCR